ncbi:hypothetical protein ACFE04_024107 [Oxalis oulophora]
MKQKVVMQLEIQDDEKRRSKAMKICAAVHGVVKVELIGSNNNVVAVTGDGIDWVELALKLRKKLGRAVIVVSLGEEKEKPKDTFPSPAPVPVTISMPEYYHNYDHVNNPNYYNFNNNY